MPNPHSPAGKHFDYSSHREWGNILLDSFMELPSWGKPGAVSLLSAIIRHRGADVSIQSTLLEHYVGGSGTPFDLNRLGPIPEKWQLWIVTITGARPGTYTSVNGENAQLAGLDDLSDSLGHFAVVVAGKSGSQTMVYEIRKAGRQQYQFGFSPGDKQRTHRHGFRIPLSDADAAFIKTHLMPTRMYDYGHLKYDEQFRIVRESHRGHRGQFKWVVYVPWRVLVNAGTPFEVYGRFER